MDDFFGEVFHLRKWNLKKGSSIELFQNISQNFVKNPSCVFLTILWLPFSLVYFPTWSLSLSLSLSLSPQDTLLVALVVLVVGFRV
jgi:hypothetical protein